MHHYYPVRSEAEYCFNRQSASVCVTVCRCVCPQNNNKPLVINWYRLVEVCAVVNRRSE